MALQHASKFVQRLILVAQLHVIPAAPYFVQYPLSDFATPVLFKFQILVCLFQKEKSDDEAENNNCCAHYIR